MIILVLLLNPPKPPKSDTRIFYIFKRITALKKSLLLVNFTRLLTVILKISPLISNSSASKLGRKIIIYLPRTPALISLLKDITVTPSRPIKSLITIIKRNFAFRPLYSRISGKPYRSAVVKIY